MDDLIRRAREALVDVTPGPWEAALEKGCHGVVASIQDEVRCVAIIDHDAIAARVRQDMKAGTPGPWKCGKNNPARVSREGRYIANFDPLHSNAPKCEVDAHRAAHLPDLEAAYLDLYDEVKRLRLGAAHAEHTTDAAISEVRRLEAERDALRAALVEHNDLLRSASQIAKREGIDGEIASTNWDAYYNRVAVVLKRHHEISNTARAALKGDDNA